MLTAAWQDGFSHDPVILRMQLPHKVTAFLLSYLIVFHIHLFTVFPYLLTLAIRWTLLETRFFLRKVVLTVLHNNNEHPVQQQWQST